MIPVIGDNYGPTIYAQLYGAGVTLVFIDE